MIGETANELGMLMEPAEQPVPFRLNAATVIGSLHGTSCPEERTHEAPLTFCLERESASTLSVPRSVSGEASSPRVSVHIFEPVRNAENQIIDFRLSFDEVSTKHPYRDFAGVKLVQVGPSVAPGETFHALKRVWDSGEPARSTTRHVCGLDVRLFQQTAERIGDAVITTTTILHHPIATCQPSVA